MKGQAPVLHIKKWIPVLVLLLCCKLFSFFPLLVERFYTNGGYPVVSKLQRLLLGWLPFSVGDLLYSVAGLWIVIKLIQFFKKCFSRRVDRYYWKPAILKLILILCWIYILFYGLWGLNYSRVGITRQFDLPVQEYTKTDLDTLVRILHEKLNKEAALLQLSGRDALRSKSTLFREGQRAYDLAGRKYPFFNSHPSSVKPSLYSYLLNYTGVQGYYNPFTGEAQVNTTIPVFVQPFIVTHEVAHQLGYAKENEANFIGFLAGKEHPSLHFQYSTTFTMYAYSISELFDKDSITAKHYDSTLHPQVKKDIREYRAFYKKYASRIEPIVSWIYGNYLKANEQPSGNRSYDEVVIWLIAWYKRYGIEAL